MLTSVDTSDNIVLKEQGVYEWHNVLYQMMKKFGLEPSTADSCVYVAKEK